MEGSGRTGTALLLAVLLWTSTMAAPIAASAGAADATADARVEDVPSASGREDAARHRTGSIEADPDRYERTGTDGARSDPGHDAIRLTNELQRVESAGEYGVTSRVEVPDEVTELELMLPARARNVSSGGFSRVDENTWEWDGTTENPRLTYRMPANRTTDREGPLAGEGNHLFVDAGAWAIVRPPSVGARWSWTGGDRIRLDRENTAEEGVASRTMAYLGPYEERTRDANGQEIRLVVPAAADLEEQPDEILDGLEYAAGAMEVGNRDPQVVVIAAPTDDVGWGVRGLQSGSADVWVRDAEPIDAADNVWFHEYVHTRQGFDATDSARWFSEATATYYAALLTLERGDIDFDDFRRILRRGERKPQASSVLADPATWNDDAEYTKGTLVAGEVDRRIRLATDGEATLATVFRELNGADGRVTGDDVLGLIEEFGGPEVREEADRLTASEETAASWDREAHDAAFGTLPARIDYAIDDDAVEVSGDYRNGTIPPDRRDPISLVAGETLRVAVTATNAGGASDEYDLAFVVDGETRDARSGRLAGGESTVERFEHAFDEPGEYELRVNGRAVTVVVSDPAPLSVTDLSVDRERVAVGESVTVSAVVSNEEPRPGREELSIRLNGEDAVAESVTLDAESRTTLEATVTLRHRGEAVVAVGERRVTVHVDDETEDRVPGFGAGVALVSVAAVALLFGRGRTG